MAKEKYYVVWCGKAPGIYTTWEMCSEQIKGFAGAKYKSFNNREDAAKAFLQHDLTISVPNTKGKDKKEKKRLANAPLPQNPPDYRHDTVLPLPPEVSANAIAVDAACSGNPGKMEYRGVDLATGEVLFHVGPIFGTNNIGEFLAIVHALGYYTAQGVKKQIYSDSRNAMLWVKKGKCKTTLTRNSRSATVYELIERAEKWLATHSIAEFTITKWNTRRWGEIPADFGRKG